MVNIPSTCDWGVVPAYQGGIPFWWWKMWFIWVVWGQFLVASLLLCQWGVKNVTSVGEVHEHGCMETDDHIMIAAHNFQTTLTKSPRNSIQWENFTNSPKITFKQENFLWKLQMHVWPCQTITENVDRKHVNTWNPSDHWIFIGKRPYNLHYWTGKVCLVHEIIRIWCRTVF